MTMDDGNSTEEDEDDSDMNGTQIISDNSSSLDSLEEDEKDMQLAILRNFMMRAKVDNVLDLTPEVKLEEEQNFRSGNNRHFS